MVVVVLQSDDGWSVVLSCCTGSKEDVQTVVQMLEDGLACFPDQEVQSLWVEWERRGGSSKSSSSR